MRVLIVGATSATAESVARLLAARGAAFYLVAPDENCARAIGNDLLVRGARQVECEQTVADDADAQASMLRRAVEALGGVETVLIAHDAPLDRQHHDSKSVLALTRAVGAYFHEQGHGALVVMVSVPLDTAVLSGLGLRVCARELAVVTMGPRAEDTLMITGTSGGLRSNAPSRVAKGVVRALEQHSAIGHLQRYWNHLRIMIRSIPGRAARRLAL